jgi:hypothetical protein
MLHGWSHSKRWMISAPNSRSELRRRPSFLARARLITGTPLVVGTIAKLEGLLPAVSMVRAMRPAALPCSRSETVTAQRVP